MFFFFPQGQLGMHWGQGASVVVVPLPHCSWGSPSGFWVLLPAHPLGCPSYLGCLLVQVWSTLTLHWAPLVTLDFCNWSKSRNCNLQLLVSSPDRGYIFNHAIFQLHECLMMSDESTCYTHLFQISLFSISLLQDRVTSIPYRTS